MRMPYFGLRTAVLLLLALAISGAFAANRSQSTNAFGEKPERLVPDYMRVTRPDSNIVHLEIAVRKFVPANARGPAVWLTGVSHIGESNYFRALQRHLDIQDLVLFEGVKQRPDDSTANAIRNVDPRSIQLTLAESLGLSFQLKAINYRRAHFHNSDLSIPELQQCLRENLGESQDAGGTTELTALLALMDGNSLLGTVVQFGVRLLGSSPKLQSLTKLMFIEAIGQLKGDLSQMQGLPPEMKKLMHVLVQRRNQAVLKDLKTALNQKPPVRSISIFYGAAHMPDMEKRLRDECAYRPAEEVWHAAISVEPAKAGVNEMEQNFIRKLVQSQMEELLQAPTNYNK
jgi:hypothetical protein